MNYWERKGYVIDMQLGLMNKKNKILSFIFFTLYYNNLRK